MMPTEWLDKHAGKNIVDLSDDEKDVAVQLYMSLARNQEDVIDAVKEHLILDAGICDSILKSDEEFGRDIKNILYAAFEASIQDCMDRYSAPVPLTFIDQALFDAGHKHTDF